MPTIGKVTEREDLFSYDTFESNQAQTQPKPEALVNITVLTQNKHFTNNNVSKIYHIL